MQKKLSERLAYLLSDNGIKSSNGLIQDLQELEEEFTKAQEAPNYSEANETLSRCREIILGE